MNNWKTALSNCEQNRYIQKTKCGLSTFDAQPGLVWLCILLMKKQKLFLHLCRHLHWSISMYMICKTLSRKRMGFSCCCWLCLFLYMLVSLLQRFICTLFPTTMAKTSLKFNRENVRDVKLGKHWETIYFMLSC